MVVGQRRISMHDPLYEHWIFHRDDFVYIETSQTSSMIAFGYTAHVYVNLCTASFFYLALAGARLFHWQMDIGWYDFQSHSDNTTPLCYGVLANRCAKQHKTCLFLF